MKTFHKLSIGALTNFADAPHPDCRMVIGHTKPNARVDELVHAGWLMPQIAEVHPKTARWQRHMARYAKENSNG